MKHIIRSFKYRNYRLFFTGQSLSLVGSWMQRLAIGWLAYELKNSALILGIVAFAGQIPALFLTPFGGVIADRYDKHKILIFTQAFAMIQAFALAFLVLSNHITIGLLIILNIFLGIINSLDMPTRQAYVIDMIDNKNDLGNAIALNSSMVNFAKLAGPTLAGLIVAAFGEGMCFLINAISYLAVIVSLLLMKTTSNNTQRKDSVLLQLKEGLKYSFGFAPIKYLILLLSTISLTAIPYMVLMPIFAKDILHGGPKTLGFLMGSAGIGALVGVVYLASRKTVLGLGRVIVIATIIFGVSLVAFSFSRKLWLSEVLLAFAGMGMMINMAASNTILQTMVSDEMRGRVMSLYVVSFMGFMPFGSLLAGSLANKIGAPFTLAIGGSICVAAAIAFGFKLPSLREIARPVYIEKGIIEQVEKGLQSASQLSVPPEN
ncbi:MAG: MFS transporter [Sedimentisphaerales bacterium]|nr:MFS transporter [Sedimentisphaerales bacterium]